MILDIQGKKLVFGMQWRTLTGSDAPPALAARIAREAKAERIWHEDQALHMGYPDAADAQAKVKDRLYSAAAALSRVTQCIPNALFVYRLEHGGQHIAYLVCGIAKGRPRVGFDQIVSDEKALAALVADFPNRCDGEFKLVGNLPDLLNLMPEDRKVQYVPYTLEMLVAEVGPYALLRRPSAASRHKRLVVLAALAVLAVAAGKYGKAEYDAYQRRLHPPPPEKTPAQRYAEDLASRAQAGVAPAGPAVAGFYQWFAEQVDITLGGWSLSSVTCEAVKTPETPCKLLYRLAKDTRGATNQTFLEALPDYFSAPNFLSIGDESSAEVVAKVPMGRAIKLGDLLPGLPTPMAVRTQFGSELQTLRPVLASVSLKAFQPFGAVVPEAIAMIPHLVSAAQWSTVGPLRNATELSRFPAGVTVDRIELAVSLDTAPDAKQSKFKLTLGGDAYARD